MHSSIRYLKSDLPGKLSSSASEKSVPAGNTANNATGLYDLWLNSMLPTVGPSMVTGVTSSSSHQIDSERIAEKLMQLCIREMPRQVAEDRI